MRRELPTKDQRKQLAEIKRRTGMAIATYRKAWLDLIRIGVVLLDADLDLAGLKKVVDGLGEVEARSCSRSRLPSLLRSTSSCAGDLPRTQVP